MSSSSHDAADRWNDIVERVVTAVEARQDVRAAQIDAAAGGRARAVDVARQEDTLGGPLTSIELSRLQQVDFESVDADLLLNLCTFLEPHVNAAASVNLIREVHKWMGNNNNNAGEKKRRTSVDEWLKGVGSSTNASLVGPGVLRYLLLRNGLDAASILLTIMTSHTDRRLMSEDSIESCILLLRHHLTKHVGPTLMNAGHLELLKASASPVKQSVATPRKRRRSSGGADSWLVKELKKVYKPIISSVPQLLLLFETMEKLASKVQMEDQSLLTLASTCMTVFTLDPIAQHQGQCHLFHVASISLLSTISKRYPQHRAILVEDLFPIFLQIPTSKKSQRTFPTPGGSEPTPRRKSASGDDSAAFTQAISVMIVSLIQSSVTFPTCATEDQPAQSGLGDCQALCDQFVSQLLQRCSKKSQEGGASEFRPVLQNLVDDFLVLQMLPNHPGAEIILLTLCRGLGNDILKASSSKKNNSLMESTYLSTAFDILGKICASVAAILASHREKPLSISRQLNETLQSRSEGRNVNSCFCGRHSLVDTFMVACDKCKGFFHGECVGLTAATASDEWMCDDCQLKQMALDATKTFCLRRNIRFHEKDVPSILETHVFRQLVLTHLEDDTVARKFRLAQWIKDLDASSEEVEKGIAPKMLAQQLLELWDKPGMLTPGKTTGLNSDGCHRVMIALTATKSNLVEAFPRQMGLLIQFMMDENFVSIRKLAVKALSQVVDADSNLMLYPAVKNAVSTRFADEAKSVREAVVGLVGSFVVSCPELANAFHSSFLPRLLDEGVSVKKRTVKIFRDILVNNPNYDGRAAACALMLKRAADPKEDDSVRDLIHELFSELWLENSEVPSPIKRLALMPETTEEEPAPSPPDGTLVTPSSSVAATPPLRRSQRVVLQSNVQIRCRLASQQMIEVVLSAGSQDMLTALLRDLLSGFSDSDKDRKASERKKRKQNASSHCAHLVESLIEHLLTLEENRGDDKDAFGKRLVATIRTIGSIAEVAPQEVLRHVDTLLPYLKAENDIDQSQECEVVSEVCDMFYRVSRIMSEGEVMRLAQGSLCDDLMKITYRFGSGALGSAVRTLCELGNHVALKKDNAFREKALKLATTFYKYLMKNVHTATDFSKTGKKTNSNVQRALSVLGCLCKSHAMENEDIGWLDESTDDEDDERKELIDAITWENMIEACYKLFTTFLAKLDSETKCSALKALSGIFISRPRVLLTMQQAGSIDAIMSRDSDPELQLQALRSWREILLAEEKRVESGEAKAKMDSNQNITLSNRISGDQDSDATLVGGVLSQHNKRLYQMTTDTNARIRYACLDLLSHLLRSGLLNPFQTIPYLFGLQGDVEAPEIRALALKLLITEGEKRPDTLRQRICAGVKNAFRFQRVVYPNQEVTAGIPKVVEGKTTYESIFGSVFKESIRNTKKQKQGLFTNLLGLFDIGDDDDDSNKKKKKKKKEVIDLPLLSFTTEVLAYLPYNTANDPLFIIHHIQNAAALQGQQHLEKMAHFLQEQGFDMDADDDDNTEEDDLEIAAKAKRPSRTKEAARLVKRSFDILHFEQLCETASSFILLLRLKSYLRKLYNLTETRCFEYNPEGGQERNFDKIASTTAIVPHFDSKIVGFFRNEHVDKDDPKEKDVDKDAVIFQYAEFRRLLRIEATTGARMAEADDEDDEGEQPEDAAAAAAGDDPMEED